MSTFLAELEQTPLLSDGATGSYLFERTGRLSETNHVYEALNLGHPDLVREIHFAYLQSGARCLTTNTFGANLTHLGPRGQGEHVDAINSAGVALAREAIEVFRAQTQIATPFFVLGSIGPTLEGQESLQEVKEVYRKQIDALVSAGVDALLLETFTSLLHIVSLIELVQERDKTLPLIVQMSPQTDTSTDWEQEPVVFIKTMADMGVDIAGFNCCAPWEATTVLDAVANLDAVREGRLQLSAMPNAGGFQRIGHRYMARVNPEYMGKLARTFAARGVKLLGGCCDVHPPHVKEMHNYLNSGHSDAVSSRAVFQASGLQPVGDERKQNNGPLSRKLKAGEFAVSVEVLPARGTAPKTLEAKVNFIDALARSGLADAVDVTDGSRGIPLMPPGDFIGIVRQRLGWSATNGDPIEFIPHFTSRDLNVMGVQGRLVGYHAHRIHNVLFITGDPPKMSPTYPRSTAVFDLDSVAMIHYTHACLNAGSDFGGQPLGRHKDPRTHFTIGSGFEPEAVNIERELDRLRRKIDAGADYIMTQPAFRHAPLEVLAPFRAQTAILVGVMILTSLDHAHRMGQIPGVVIPDEIYQRLSVYEKAADQGKVGKEIAVEQIHWIREQEWAGLYMMSPDHRPILDTLTKGLA